MPGANKDGSKQGSSHCEGSAASQDSAAGPGDGIDPSLKAFLLAIKDEINRSTEMVVDKINKGFDKNDKEMALLRRDMMDRDKSIDTRMGERSDKALKERTPAPPSTACEKDATYHYCRRSVMIWPIEEKVANLADEVKCFKSKHGFSEERIIALGKIESPIPPGKEAKERKEVLTTFELGEDRYAVIAAGVNRARFKECSMLLHVPGHLIDDVIVLSSIAYKIKTKNTGVKRLENAGRRSARNHEKYQESLAKNDRLRNSPL